MTYNVNFYFLPRLTEGCRSAEVFLGSAGLGYRLQAGFKFPLSSHSRKCVEGAVKSNHETAIKCLNGCSKYLVHLYPFGMSHSQAKSQWIRDVHFSQRKLEQVTWRWESIYNSLIGREPIVGSSNPIYYSDLKQISSPLWTTFSSSVIYGNEDSCFWPHIWAL